MLGFGAAVRNCQCEISLNLKKNNKSLKSQTNAADSGLAACLHQYKARTSCYHPSNSTQKWLPPSRKTNCSRN